MRRRTDDGAFLAPGHGRARPPQRPPPPAVRQRGRSGGGVHVRPAGLGRATSPPRCRCGCGWSGPSPPAAVLILPGYLWGHRTFTRAIAWALEGRTPSARRAVRGAARALAPGVATAAVLGARRLHLRRGSRRCSAPRSSTVARVVVGTVLGGVTTCALGYLLIERSFRPLFAHVLDRVPDRRPRTPGIRLRLLLTWAVGSGVPLLAMALVLFLDGNEIPPVRPGDAVARRAGRGLPRHGGLGHLGGRAARRRAPRRWPGSATTTSTSASSSTTAARSARCRPAFNRMVDGLRERRQIQDLFGRHVGHGGRHAGARAGHGAARRGARRQRRVRRHRRLDGHGRGAPARRRGRDAQRLLRRRRAGGRRAEGGWVNKFEGDGALCVFGAPGDAARPRRPGAAGRRGCCTSGWRT